MEEDIKILEEMKANCIKGMMKGAIYTDEKAERKAIAIENLIKGYRDGEDILKNITKENLELKEYIRELEESNKILQDLYWNECIPKSKIKEKIEPVIDSLEENDFVGYADELRDIMSELMEDK